MPAGHDDRMCKVRCTGTAYKVTVNLAGIASVKHELGVARVGEVLQEGRARGDVHTTSGRGHGFIIWGGGALIVMDPMGVHVRLDRRRGITSRARGVCRGSRVAIHGERGRGR